MYKFENLIEEVKELNTELKYGLDDIVGVTIEKGLIPTVANLTQTALDKFYIVKPETFIYNPRTHGVRLGMGYNETSDTYITSWNNVAFRVKETAQNIVLPQYLWLYFCRPIWDRITNFLAWGSSTIVFAWKDFLNIDIDLPSIEKQREIVEEYETLLRRIRLNEQMIEKLEATAQALYRKMFVDGIDKENLPEGWRMGTLGDVAEVSSGKTCLDKVEKKETPYIYPVAGASGIIGYSSTYNYDEQVLTTGRVGTLGVVNKYKDRVYMADNVLVIKSQYYEYSYQILQQIDYNEITKGGVQSLITQTDLKAVEIIIPDTNTLVEYENTVLPMFKMIEIKQQENSKLSELQSLLLAKMGRLKQ